MEKKDGKGQSALWRAGYGPQHLQWKLFWKLGFHVSVTCMWTQTRAWWEAAMKQHCTLLLRYNPGYLWGICLIFHSLSVTWLRASKRTRFSSHINKMEAMLNGMWLRNDYKHFELGTFKAFIKILTFHQYSASNMPDTQKLSDKDHNETFFGALKVKANNENVP